MTLNTPQLHLLRSLDSRGWPVDLHSILLLRCGANLDDWQRLVQAGLVQLRNRRWVLTREGRTVYNREKKGRYF